VSEPWVLTSVLGNSQRLDGGAMFGNAPRALWSRWITPDDQNRIPLACRCLLARSQGRTVLFETGIGAFFEPSMRVRFGVEEPGHVLLDHLAAAGAPHDTIDAVVLSHLHFDHAGGLLTQWVDGHPLALLFPKATFLVGARAWERAKHPHPRDRASFVPGLCELLEATGRLRIVDGPTHPDVPGARFHQSDGHTPGLLLAELPTAKGPVVFGADLVPGRAWVHLPITMGYDRSPELLIDEKGALFEDLAARGGFLFFTHDAEVACSRLTKVNGRFQAVDDLPTLQGWGA
jgi:glyoxylase-like metal-dependent hydrolase (beta-lactamase superfamily II)